MNDNEKDALIKKLQGQVQSLESEKAKADDVGQFDGYSCAKCKQRINMSFILPFIRSSGLCPHCYHEK